MIDEGKVREIVGNHICSDMFVVDVRVSSSNKITVLIDREEGVTIDDCARLNRLVEENLDRDAEDFELEISSPGLNEPFRVVRQYLKNRGEEVEVLTKEGKKHKGVLKDVLDNGFVIDEKIKVKGSGKRPDTKIKEREFQFEYVKATRLFIDF